MTKKWEHMIVEDPTEEKLNKLGEEGWELVSVTEADTSTIYEITEYTTAYLKREKD